MVEDIRARGRRRWIVASAPPALVAGAVLSACGAGDQTTVADAGADSFSSSGASDSSAGSPGADVAAVDATYATDSQAPLEAGAEGAPGTSGQDGSGGLDVAVVPESGLSQQDGSVMGVPALDHVLLILMENESQSDIRGNASAPYINGTLLSRYAFTTNYSTTYHPSLPNYLDLTSGSPQGVSCDCQPSGNACDATCALFTGACACNKAVSHVGDQLDSAGIPWRAYAESMGSPCNAGAAAPFAAKHVPFLYYDDVFKDSSRCPMRVRDYAADFAGDLAGGMYRYAFISPNLCSDMHGDPSCPMTDEIAQGDTWLSHEVPKIVATAGFAAGGRDALFIVWDEQTGSTGGRTIPMLCIVISPLAKPGSTATAYNHESLLATIEDGLALPRLGNAAQAPAITDIWR